MSCRMKLLLTTTMALLLNMACEVDTRVSIDGRNPPTFSFDGTGYLTFFTVKEIAPENQSVPNVEQDPSKNRIIWWVWPTQPLEKPMKYTTPITYGKIPDGFYQKVPESGVPPPLTEGKVYEAGGQTASAHGGYIRFTVRDGQAVQLKIPTRQ